MSAHFIDNFFYFSISLQIKIQFRDRRKKLKTKNITRLYCHKSFVVFYFLHFLQTDIAI